MGARRTGYDAAVAGKIVAVVLSIALLGLGLFTARKAEWAKAHEGKSRTHYSVNAYRLMEVFMALAGAVALIILGLFAF